jgi:hypothetical protein
LYLHRVCSQEFLKAVKRVLVEQLRFHEVLLYG